MQQHKNVWGSISMKYHWTTCNNSWVFSEKNAANRSSHKHVQRGHAASHSQFSCDASCDKHFTLTVTLDDANIDQALFGPPPPLLRFHKDIYTSRRKPLNVGHCIGLLPFLFMTESWPAKLEHFWWVHSFSVLPPDSPWWCHVGTSWPLPVTSAQCPPSGSE